MQWVVIRTILPYVMFPVALAVGIIGYNAESLVRGDKKPAVRQKTIQEERADRLLEEALKQDCTKVESLKVEKDTVKTSILKTNLPKVKVGGSLKSNTALTVPEQETES